MSPFHSITPPAHNASRCPQTSLISSWSEARINTDFSESKPVIKTTTKKKPPTDNHLLKKCKPAVSGEAPLTERQHDTLKPGIKASHSQV